MAPDDRDRNLDKALARHFRASADAVPAAASSPAPALSACPDAEILAAYHDGSLTPEDLALWKPHVLSCGDCQLVLEHLATPLEAPVSLSTDAPVLAAAVWNAPPIPAPSAPAAVSIVRPRKTYFRWLVPAGAIAAGLLSWVVMRQSGVLKLQPKIESIPVQTAENRQAPPPPSAAPTAPTSSATAQLKRVSPTPNAADQALSPQFDQLRQDLDKQKEEKGTNQEMSGRLSAIGGSREDLSAQTRAAEQQLRDRTDSARQASPSHAATPGHGPRLTQQQQQMQQNQRVLGGPFVDTKKAQAEADAELRRAGDALTAQLPPPATKSLPEDAPNFVDSGSVAPQPPAKVAKAAAAARAPSPAPPSTNSASGAAPPPPPAPESADKAASSAAVSALTQSITLESSAPSTNTLRLASAAARGPQTFNDPAFKSSWRVGPAGSVEFSSDNGATWTPQSTGVTSELFTGSAPASKVCWIVGAKGAILRTTDAGKHWLKIHSPVAVDILGINASDAFHATLWLLPDPKSAALQTYKTSDGGLTWSLIPNN